MSIRLIKKIILHYKFLLLLVHFVYTLLLVWSEIVITKHCCPQLICKKKYKKIYRNIYMSIRLIKKNYIKNIKTHYEFLLLGDFILLDMGSFRLLVHTSWIIFCVFGLFLFCFFKNIKTHYEFLLDMGSFRLLVHTSCIIFCVFGLFLFQFWDIFFGLPSWSLKSFFCLQYGTGASCLVIPWTPASWFSCCMRVIILYMGLKLFFLLIPKKIYKNTLWFSFVDFFFVWGFRLFLSWICP